MSNDIQNITSAVNVIKTAILQNQTRAVKAVNQEMLALYYWHRTFHFCQHTQ